jgi:hypothetical protein
MELLLRCSDNSSYGHSEGFLGDNRIRKLEGFREEITRSNFTPNWIVKLFGQLIRINDLSD